MSEVLPGTATSLDMVLGILRGPAILQSGAPLAARMEVLCRQTAELLGCDRSSILLWNGHGYQGAYNWGNPPEIAAFFDGFVLRPDAPIIQRLESTAAYIVINDARTDPLTEWLARMANIQSIVAAPLSEPDGSLIGVMTAEFNERMGEFDALHAVVTQGAAHLAHAAIMQSRERTRRVELSQAVLDIEDTARRRIGRDIHDDVLQRSFALTLKIQTLLSQVTDPWIAGELETILEDARIATTTLRQVTTHVHPEGLHAVGLKTLIQDLLALAAAQQGWQVHFDDDRTSPNSEEVERTIGRIAQQAVHNASRHAKASCVSVSISTAAGGTALEITDDGVGFDPGTTPAGRLGLVTMFERAMLMQGTFRVESKPGAGTSIHVWIPDTGTAHHPAEEGSSQV